MAPIFSNLPRGKVKKTRKARIKGSGPIDDPFIGVILVCQTETSKDPLHMNIDGDVNGEIVGKRDLEVSSQNVCGHGPDLGPYSPKLKKPIYNLRTGGLIGPDLAGISRIFFIYALHGLAKSNNSAG